MSLSTTATAPGGEPFAFPMSLDAKRVGRVVVGSARNWAHFTHLVVGGSTVFVLYAALYRLALVPRVLAALGMAVAVMQMTAVTMPFHGRPVAFAMLMPLAVTHLALALWLVTRRFETRRA